jgi:hypothetical protein
VDHRLLVKILEAVALFSAEILELIHQSLIF